MLVVERPSRASYSVAEVKTAADAQEELSRGWARTLELIAEQENLLNYSPDLVLRSGDPQIPVTQTNLVDESEVIAALLAEADRPEQAPRAIASEHLYLYALVSDTAAGRVAMVKKQTPVKRASAGKRWALAGKELTVIADDPWQIHPHFDLVISAHGTYVLRLAALDQLLGDSAVLLERVGAWVSAVADSLPIAAGQGETLIARCEQSSRLRVRLRAINSRGHLSRVGIGEVEAHAKRMKLDPKEFIENGELLVSETNADQLLKLLNEDLFTGGLTGDPFVSGGKEPLR
jgi:hypothetical protein